MPELPEVETIKRGLSKLIIKQNIRRVDVLCEKSFIGAAETVKNALITDVRRFGKALVIDLDNEKSLMAHLRMTGQFIYDPKNRTERYAAGHPSENFVDTLPNRQTRVVLSLTDGTLYFNDQRKFGFLKVLETAAVPADPFIKKLAPDPWHLDPATFAQQLQRHQNSSIKAVLLDQTIVCGLGNIYADETLFLSKIHPQTKAGRLTPRQASMILNMAAKVMDTAIASGGSTLRDYKKADGTRGDYLDKFAQVFNKTGQPCPVCGSPIIKIRVAGRGTHLCPHCQKEPHA